MSNSIRDIKRRIVSVQKTQKITSALKLVAAAKFKKHQSAIHAMRVYSDRLYELMHSILQRSIDLDHPFFQRREGKTLYVILTSDRGLCGGFNQNIFRQLSSTLQTSQDLMVLGTKGIAYYKRKPYNLVDTYKHIPEELSSEMLVEVNNTIVDYYLKGKYSRILLVYNEFKSAMAQDIAVDELLPIDVADFDTEKDTCRCDYIYEPGPGAVIEEVARQYLFTKLQRALLESMTAEQGSRMTAMDSATDNAEELIGELTLSYNRARQSAITTELSEIVAGAEGLR